MVCEAVIICTSVYSVLGNDDKGISDFTMMESSVGDMLAFVAKNVVVGGTVKVKGSMVDLWVVVGDDACDSDDFIVVIVTASSFLPS